MYHRAGRLKNYRHIYRLVRENGQGGIFLYTYTIKPPALRVVPHPALALDNKTSNAIISVGPKPHYI